MSVQVNIICKGPVYFEDGPAIISQEAIDYVPGETVEQLISRVLYRMSWFHKGRGNIDDPRFTARGDAHEQTLEIRLVREAE
jgi:hypothetical protein